MPDGSRQRTSDRSVSAIRSVGRSTIEGALPGTFRSARRSPNWRLPSISAVRLPAWPKATARLSAIVVVPTPPFGAKTVTSLELPADCGLLEQGLDAVDPADEVVAGERHRQDGVDALGRIGLDRLLGHRQDDDRDARPGGMELADERGPLDPALEQRVDDHHVGPELGDLGRHLRAIGHDVQQLDLLLGVQQAPDVLTDLRDVLDDEQADLIGGGHRADYTKPTSLSRLVPGGHGSTGGTRRSSAPGRTVDLERARTRPVAVDLARLVGLGGHPDASTAEPERLPRRAPAELGPVEQLERAADPAGQAGDAQDEQVEQPVVGLDRQSRPDPARDQLAGVGDEGHRRLELEPLSVDVDDVRAAGRARRAARGRRPSRRACRSDASRRRRSPP